MKISSKFVPAALGALLLMAGCASAPRFETKTADHLSHYRHIVIDTVEVAPTADPTLKPHEAAALAETFRLAMVKELKTAASESDVSGPDVLRLKLTVTHLNVSRPVVNTLSMLLLFLPLDPGGVSIEAKFFDAVTGESVAVTEHSMQSTPLSIGGSLHRYGHATRSLRDWSRNLEVTLKAGQSSGLQALSKT